uniref:Translation initiation factor beta propellor-like domain-containing protein n=1 Tax=Ananas comosus var. bracteatus TaxID=296719 RepID=A0A6V7QLY3_ANACO|nr:unnamed protein product [Ananas comosus var. bracteatus]
MDLLCTAYGGGAASDDDDDDDDCRSSGGSDRKQLGAPPSKGVDRRASSGAIGPLRRGRRRRRWRRRHSSPGDTSRRGRGRSLRRGLLGFLIRRLLLLLLFLPRRSPLLLSELFLIRIFRLMFSHLHAVNSVQWSQSHGHLLASAGMDQAVHIWNVWNTKQPKARIFNYHKAAVKDVRWTPNGLSLLSCGFDCSSRVVDVEKGKKQISLKRIKLWSADGKHFITSSDTSKSNISENCIIIWDVVRQVPLSNQVYTEAYTCPCVRYHPTDASFVAQSNGNYIAIFSAWPPFKLDRYRRYEGHGVWGFPIKCNFSLDGRELTSGSSDGSIYLYDYKTARLLRKLKAFNEACIDVVYHPVKPNVIASCSWNGEVSVFE